MLSTRVWTLPRNPAAGGTAPHTLRRRVHFAIQVSLFTVALAVTWNASFAGPLRDRALEHRAAQERNEVRGADSTPGALSLPVGIRVVRDVPYGSDSRQRFDVYAPARANGAPVIFMVHGGAWALGDKAARSVVENKVAHWVPQGFVVVSTNYRLLPKADPLEQARDVGRALAMAQDHAASWGGDRGKFVLMGHSAGAHLVALLATSPSLSAELGLTPWLGSVLLDSAALDVALLMEARHARFYDRAFGTNPGYWRTASPFHALTRGTRPILAVCSTRRQASCSQVARFVAKAASLGVSASELKQDMSHKELNVRLGEERRYTEAVESFLRTLDPLIAATLTNHAGARR